MTAPLAPDEAARLETLRSLRILDTLPEAEYDDLVWAAGAMMDVPLAYLSLVDEARQWFKAREGFALCESAREGSFCAHTILGTEPVVASDLARDARFAGSAFVTGPLGLRFYAGAPIVVEGHAVGTLCCVDSVPRQPSARQVEGLAALARQAGALMAARRQAREFAGTERRFAAFLDHSPAVAFLKDEAGRMRYVNRRFEAMFDRPADEVIGRTDYEWLPEAFADACAKDDATVRESGTLTIEERVPTSDTTFQIWQTHKFSIDMDGVGWVGGIALDVTALREAEARVSAQNAELRRREEALEVALAEAETAGLAAQMAAARFEQLFDGLPVACFTYGRGGTIHEWNSAAAHLWGISAGEALLAPTIGTAVSEANRAEQEEIDRRVFEGETVRGVERHETMRDGRERWLLTSTFPLRTPSGAIVGAVCASLDVTKRKRAEEAMREAKTFAEGMADSATSMLYLVDFDTKAQVWSNKDWVSTLGYPGSEFLASDLLERIMHPEDLAGLPEVSGTLARAADREVVEFEARFRHADGEWRWLWFRESVYRRKADGSPALIMGSAQDVTERKRMEADLRASEARFRTVVESLHEGLTVQDADGRILLWNPSAGRIIGADLTGSSALDGLGTEWRLVREDGSPFDPQEMPIPVALRTGEAQASVVVGVETTKGTQWLSVNAAPLAAGEAVSSFVDITERKRMEAEIREKEARLRTVLDSLHEGVVVQDAAGRVSLWNRSAERVLGISGEAMDLQSARDPRSVAIREDGSDFPIADRPVARAIREGGTQTATIGTLSPSGERRWHSVMAVPLLPEDGSSAEWAVASFMDVTESRRVEAELRASEETFRTVIGSLREGLVVHDRAGQVVLWNESAERILGVPGEVLSLDGDADPRNSAIAEDGTTIHREDRPAIRALTTGEANEGTMMGIVRPDGERRWLSVSAAPVRTGSGEIDSAVASLVDVTERMRMEAALRDSEARFRTVVESLHEGVAVQDAEGRFLLWNAGAERILGLSGDQMAGRRGIDPSWRAVCPDETPMPIEAFPTARVLSTGKAQSPTLMGVDHADGTRRWLNVNATPMTTPQGDRVAVASFIDVTERHEQERRLREYADELKTANARLEGLATTDGLTGLKNHRFFQDWLRRRIDQCASGLPLSIALVDVDRFKLYNDDFGHQAGDAVLRGVAGALQSAVRAGDLVARYGGEEFVVVMPGANAERALATTERLRVAVAALPFPVRAVTASFGVATLGEGLADAPSLIGAADEALYASKDGGRNRVTHCRTLTPALEAA